MVNTSIYPDTCKEVVALNLGPFNHRKKKTTRTLKTWKELKNGPILKKKLGIKVLDMRLTHDVYVYMHAGLATSVHCGRWLFCYFRAAAV